jgi:hypothetical protein
MEPPIDQERHRQESLQTDTQIHAVTGIGNGGTALWLQDCSNVQAFGVTDRNDTNGYTAIIEGSSVGCSINGRTKGARLD